MAVSRRRERSLVALSGQITNTDDGDVYPQFEEVTWKRTDDVWKKKVRDDGTLPTSPLLIQDRDRRGSGTFSGRKGRYVFNHVPYNSSPSPLDIGRIAQLERTDAEYISALLAETNPFRYEVSVPVMVAELIEAATLLKLSFAGFFALGGSLYLNAKFGWFTMIDDIKALAGITTTIERRVREFNSLLQHGGLRRKVVLSRGTETTSGSNYQVYSSYGTSIRCNWTEIHSSKVWGTVRWRPVRKDAIPVDKLAQFNLAAQQVLDLELPDPATVWEAIPFSWLIDYFITVGDTLKAIESTDLVEPYDICLMKDRSITCSYFPVSMPPGFSGTRGRGTDRYRYRTVHNSDLTQLLGFSFGVTPGQYQTMLALLASRRR